MHAASYNESPDVLTVLLQAGAKIDDRDNAFNTALIYAAAHNPNTAVISTLLKAGAGIEARNSDGMTPLMVTGQYCQNPEVVAFLAKAGALVGDRDRNGETPLMFAAANNRNPEIITALLKAGANIDEPDSFGRTSLMVAASFTKFPEVIETLLKSGADTKRKDNQGRTAFDCAKENKSLDGTKALWDLDYTHLLAYGLLIVQYRFYDIFPVFYSFYDTHPLGQVVIINTLDRPVTDVRMSFFVKEFMNSPRQCPVPSTLLPNEPATADLFAVFQPSILQVTENMKVEAEVTLEYTENGISQKKVVPHTFAILKRNALDWSDTKRASHPAIRQCCDLLSRRTLN
jgi:ankyrin repeat protein